MSSTYSGPTGPDSHGNTTTEPLNPKAQARADKAYRKAMRPWYKKKRFILPLLFLGLLILLGALGGGDDADTGTDAAPAAVEPAEPAVEVDGEAPAEPAVEAEPVEPAEPAVSEQPAEPEEPAIVVSAQEMIEVLEGNALSAKNTYEDKRVTVSGFVGNIDASGSYFALDPEPDALIFTGVQVQTSEEFLDQVASFTAGQEVTVTGTVTGVGEVLGYSIEAETIEP